MTCVILYMRLPEGSIKEAHRGADPVLWDLA